MGYVHKNLQTSGAFDGDPSSMEQGEQDWSQDFFSKLETGRKHEQNFLCFVQAAWPKTTVARFFLTGVGATGPEAHRSVFSRITSPHGRDRMRCNSKNNHSTLHKVAVYNPILEETHISMEKVGEEP